MRCNQVSICIERFGEYVPKEYPADVQRIHVYCDDYSSIYAALSKAISLAINELSEYESIGVRTDVSTNEFSYIDYKEAHGVLPKERRPYDIDLDLEYTGSRLRLLRDYIWVYEHSDEILAAIKECNDRKEIAPVLKERFDLDDRQIRKLSQIRLDMLDKGRYEEVKGEIREMEERIDKRREGPVDFDSVSHYYSKIRELREEISMIDAHFKAAENYTDILSIVLSAGDNGSYYETMKERYGFTRNEARAIRYAPADEYSQTKLEEMKKIRQRYVDDMEMYRKWIKEAESDRESVPEDEKEQEL